MSITESDVKQKFDEWFEREYKHLESSKYTDAVPHIKYGFWMAYRAAVAEFLGKSENFMNIISELQGSLVVSDFKEACKYGKEIKELKSRNDTLVEALEKAQTINAAAEKLVRCKGRYHSEQNYRALAALFGVTTPDLPPLDSESRTVTVSKSDIFNVPGGETYVGGEMISVDTLRLYLAEHGIKWEAE